MKFTRTPELLGVCMTVAAVFSTFSVGAISATPSATPTAAETRYQQDRADCMAGKTAENQKTCLKEAGAALQAAREHDLKKGDSAQLAANARKRCEPMTGDDRKACIAMADGQGTTSGSVASGGQLHELVTVVPGNAPDAPPAPAHSN
jgi:hypothetical protein